MKSQLAIRKSSQNLFLGYGVSILLGTLGAIFFETPIPLLLPAALIVLFQVIVDYEKIYYLLFLCIPLSTEVFISDHLATDLPTEFLIVGIMFLYIFIAFLKPKSINGEFLKHPLTLMLLLHFGWTVLTTIVSSNFGFSVKFSLAKFWYIVTFYLFAGYLIKSPKKINLLLWLVAIPLAIATAKVILHHATLDFGFKKINESTSPFFRNHVSYAAILALFIPFMLYLNKWTTTKKWKTITLTCLGIIIFGVITAYTRAAYVALAGAFLAYWVIRLRLMKIALTISVIVILGVVNFLVVDNAFMELAPSEKTVAHTELTDIVNSTSKLEDVSTMERYYRWIAAAQMIGTKPILGFGPGNFYHFYKHYTLERFSTYVSANPEKSGVHNYYLMVAVEQGILGLLIFVIMVLYLIVYGEKVYHSCKRRKDKDLIMAAILSSLIIDAFLLMNDMIETDKVGSFFFFNMAIVVLVDLYNKQLLEKEKELVTPEVPSEKPL